MRRNLLAVLLLAAASQAFAGTGKVIINNIDLPGVGLNDPTPVAPVAGNPGTTLGQQRLNVFQAAAAKWSTMLDTNVNVIVASSFVDLPCDDTGAVLAQAGPARNRRDFPNAPKAGVWYPIALANKYAGFDMEPTSSDIIMSFNNLVDNPTCQGASNWYYGLDGNEGIHSDFYIVALHEMAHGLGFSGATRAPGFRDGLPAVFDTHTFDVKAGLRWDQMTPEQRQISLTNTGNLVWDGENVRSFAKRYLQPVTSFAITEPSLLVGNYDIGMAAFGPSAGRTALTGKVVRALDASNSSGPTTFDGCTSFLNADAIRGNVALIDRGSPPLPAEPCTFVKKARNAQAAGATGAIIVDNSRSTCTPPAMSGDAPDVTIPVFSISAVDGDTVKTQLTAGTSVNGSLRSDPSQLGGTSREGYVRLYAPCTDDPGSSVHHFDVASSPNLLMEPFVNGDLLLNVDLTIYQLLDIGWTLPAKSGRRNINRK
jgi:PA domain